MLNIIKNVVGGIAKPISDMYGKHTERKMVKESAKAKLKMAKATNQFDLDMSDKEWEAIGKAAENSTWRDEYVTIIITIPIPLLFVGCVYAAFTGDVRLMEGTLEGIKALEALKLNMGELMTIVVLAAVGLKAIHK